jgi:hypothetical protein
MGHPSGFADNPTPEAIVDELRDLFSALAS